MQGAELNDWFQGRVDPKWTGYFRVISQPSHSVNAEFVKDYCAVIQEKHGLKRTLKFLDILVPSIDISRYHGKYCHHLEDLNVLGVYFPVKMSDVGKSQCLNSVISLSIFGWQNALCDSSVRSHSVDHMPLIYGKESYYAPDKKKFHGATR
ncbi:hypothetical protein CHS0354_026067 [Potamilus streckersoni]|uniref:Uncharacterized protein n=1 Tax=Potamilus streckersoni TaxID=2493646 RepID=A0AAE0SGH0_9BIVA|nr:hypothetical protein CHS0354_026067 [Potamilus streckersoni]